MVNSADIEAVSLKKINALRVLASSGLVEAVRLFPQFKDFLEKNNGRSFEDAKREVIESLNKTKV